MYVSYELILKGLISGKCFLEGEVSKQGVWLTLFPLTVLSVVKLPLASFSHLEPIHGHNSHAILNFDKVPLTCQPEHVPLQSISPLEMATGHTVFAVACP